MSSSTETAEAVAKELLDLAEVIRRKREKFEGMGDTEVVKILAFLEKFVRDAAETWPKGVSAKEAAP